MTINWRRFVFAFERKGEPIFIRDDGQNEQHQDFELGDELPKGLLLTTVQQFLELFSGMRVERIASSDDDATYELMPS